MDTRRAVEDHVERGQRKTRESKLKEDNLTTILTNEQHRINQKEERCRATLQEE